MPKVRLGQYVLGIEGLALLRQWLVRDSSEVRERLDELVRLVEARDEGLAALELDVPVLDSTPGYAQWAPTYDETPNPLVRVEEPVVRSLIDPIPPGTALDAGCGTGRHSAYLASRGFSVLGTDSSPEMLERARSNCPSGEFRVGDLHSLPFDSERAELVVCALTLTHCEELSGPVRELTRVMAPGGHLLVSDLHPFSAAFGGQAIFQREDGSYGVVQGRLHPHGEYVDAFLRAGLEVQACHEPTWGEEEVRILGGPLFDLAPDGFRAALLGLPGAVVWRLRKPD